MSDSAKFDKDGFLVDLSIWSPELAQSLAQNEGLELGAEHWEVIHLLRDFYQEFELSPAMRPLIKYVKIHLGAEKAVVSICSDYFLAAQPNSPPK